MTFQFSCPQGHILEGEPSQIGQLFQCPFCGESFTIPSPAEPTNPYGGAYMQGLPPWPAGQPMQGFPQQGPPAQPFVPAQPKPETPAEPEAEKPKFVFDFDPRAKAPLPFDIPGSSSGKFSFDQPLEAHRENASEPAPLISPLPLPSPLHSEPSTDFTGMIDEPKKVQMLHVRCPAGHALKISRDQHGKPARCSVCKQVFEVRYENSLEYQRRTEKVLSRAESKAGQAWLAWAILAAFVGIAGLIALIVYANRGG